MERIEFAAELAVQAGNLALSAQRKGFTVGSKGGDRRNEVTSVDIAVSAFVEEKIVGVFPHERLYSEERPEARIEADAYWAVDPIDGTSNFVRQIPHFATVISYIERGQAVLGAIYNPVTQELWSFKRGGGAFLNGAPIRVSERTALEDAYVLLQIGRAPEGWEWGLRLKKAFLTRAKKSGAFGSSALDLAFLASGRVDAVVYGTMTTADVAAAIGLVREAGGEVYASDGTPADFRTKPQRIIATPTPALFDSVRNL